MNPYDCLLIYALPYQMVTNTIMAVYCFPPNLKLFPQSTVKNVMYIEESLNVSTVTIFSAVEMTSDSLTISEV